MENKIFEVYMENLHNGSARQLWLPIDSEELENIYNQISYNGEFEVYTCVVESEVNYDFGDYVNIYELNKFAEDIISMDIDTDVIEAFLDDGYDLENVIKKYEEGNYYIYNNCYDMEDVAMKYCDEFGILSDIQDNLRYYFDYEAYGRDMQMQGYSHFYFTGNGDCVEVY